jgi:hypothetical protein
LNSFLFVQGEGLPKNGMYCSVNEYRTSKLVLLHSGIKSENMKLDRVKASLDFFANTQVTGEVVSCSRGIEGRGLRFDGALQLLSPQQKARLERDLGLHDLFSPVCLRAVISQTVPDKAIATGDGERQGQDGVATQVYRVAPGTSPKSAPAVGRGAFLQMRGLALENITPPQSSGRADNEGKVLEDLVSKPRDEVRQAEGEVVVEEEHVRVTEETQRAHRTTLSSSAHDATHDAKKQQVPTKKILKHWTNARLERAWETWSGLRSENNRLTKAGAGEQERVCQEERDRKRERGMERDVEISRDEAGQALVCSKKQRAREGSPRGQGMGVCEGVRLQEGGW